MQTEKVYYLKNSRLPLILYGAGGVANELTLVLRRLTIRIDALCDSDPAKHGLVIAGLPVFNPDEIPSRFGEYNILIAVNSLHDQAVRDRLRVLMTPDHRIFVFDDVYPTYAVPIVGYSVNPLLDCYRLIHCLGDDESKVLFRLRYRHWLLADRPYNPATLPSGADGFVPFAGTRENWQREEKTYYPNAATLSDILERFGEDAVPEALALEFMNDDPAARRAIFAIRNCRRRRRLFMRPGRRPVTTMLYAVPGGGRCAMTSRK